MLEEERKYEVEPRFALPDLTGALPSGGRIVERPAVTLTATYYDAPDLRLARAGVSLRYRRGDAEPWTVKLPADVPGVRHEISRGGGPDIPPADLVALVTAYSLGAPLEPATVVRTVRQAYELRDGNDRMLAELADDAVSVLDGRKVKSKFREIEVERKAGGRKLLDRVEEALREAGAVAGGFTPKHVRALGEAAAGPPDLVSASDVPRKPKAGEVVTAAIRRGIGRILTHDPLVRLRAPVGDNDTAVHQMRVGCRRLRSDLRTFGPLVEASWAKPLRDELGWIAGLLGGARDAEVLRARLRRTAATDPLAPPDEAAVARIDADLAARHEDALVALDEGLRSDRYVKLVEVLVAAAKEPHLTPLARSRAVDVLPKLVSRPWRQFAHGSRGIDGAAELDPYAPDEQWHAVRINGKRARYAVEAVAGVLGGAAPELAKALAGVQDLLGEHQDAATAAETWLAIAMADPDDHALAVTAGRLFERERAAIRTVRTDFPDAWDKAAKPRMTAWLP
ncbi:CYTH and CHAD domain-containing protein [Phytohabitans rumicis]|uniref:CHAD domain-containing protein n=1 Tax=Phytohabitans rumicis TaxID=1076125 RepID=A0A6V8L8V3_9ACTN|nr:CYTH and CHAD domain-containing protein [Phytohabitans rumicis]GFJ89125.1 CHAD domain-containing protein [Phytohabitans rumicis]